MLKLYRSPSQLYGDRTQSLSTSFFASFGQTSRGLARTIASFDGRHSPSQNIAHKG